MAVMGTLPKDGSSTEQIELQSKTTASVSMYIESF